MNVVDIIIIIFLLFGALLGFKRGFTKQLLYCVGLIGIVILAFILKNPVSILLYENLPFFKFGGIFKGVTVLNILVYEILSFFLVLAILMIILKVLMLVSSIFEKFLNMTIILGIPSKILGALLGVIENFMISFIALYILSLPVLNINIVEQSKFKDAILTKTPILSIYTEDMVKVIEEFADLKEKYTADTDPNNFNLEALDLLLKHKIVSIDSVNKLMEKNKLDIKNIDTVLEKYR